MLHWNQAAQLKGIAAAGPRYRRSGESCPPTCRGVAARHRRDTGFHAADDSAERCSAMGTTVPIISSKTRTRPASSSRSRVPTKSANGPQRMRTDCPSTRAGSNIVRLPSDLPISDSTTPMGTGIGRSSHMTRDETPIVLRTDSQRSRSRLRMRKR
jgi:hypothetical protein